MREEVIGNARLFLGDCREILPGLGCVDAIISDPPYGQRHRTNVAMNRRSILRGPSSVHSRAKVGTYHGGKANIWPDEIAGDDQPFDPEMVLKAAKRVLLWGAHRFADRLPAGSWLVWDKVPNGKVRDQGDGEAAWLNDDPPRPMRIHRLLWDGVCVGSAARHEVTAGQARVHPTQKPVALMAWCIAQARLPFGALVCDPYMGAGSTGLACAAAGHPFVGIETVPQFFDTACRRIEQAQRQQDMFLTAMQRETA
jgi:site-specific DNA-methyltransferase (adenine-specific)